LKEKEGNAVPAQAPDIHKPGDKENNEQAGSGRKKTRRHRKEGRGKNSLYHR
jgi:hypothetical protein